jgi:hypothetical protein
MAAAGPHGTLTVKRLCDMPDEVIHTIVAKLDDMRAVLRLSQTSHRFAHASRPELWRKMLQNKWGAEAVAGFEKPRSVP